MNRRFIFLVAAAALASSRAEVLDRIAVSVGKQVIAESDVLREMRVAAFLDQKPVDFSGDQKRKAADRLVDQLLILEEAGLTGDAVASPEDAAKMLEQVKSQHGTDEKYRGELEHYRITEEDVKNQLLAGLRALRFTDLRFRPEVQVSQDELHDFYNTMVEEWKRKNQADIPTFEASREQTEKLLTDQRTAQALDRWLGIRRTETQIVYREQVFK
jgi:hypothetical protein